MAKQSIDSPSMNGEEGLVKTLVRGLIHSGGIYARARLAADQESDPEKREMREFAAERAKMALQEDIATANTYIEILAQKIEGAKNGSTTDPKQEREVSAEIEDLQEEIRDQKEEISDDETDTTTDPTDEADAPESQDESSQVSEEEGAEEEEEEESDDTVTQAEETEAVEEMFGLAKGTADAISEVLFSGSRNAIEPNEKLSKRNLEKIALVLDALDIDEAEVRDKTRAFLSHKGFDDEAIIEETIEAVTNLWKGYQQ